MLLFPHHLHRRETTQRECYVSSVFGGFIDSQDYFDCSLSIFSSYKWFWVFFRDRLHYLHYRNWDLHSLGGTYWQWFLQIFRDRLHYLHSRNVVLCLFRAGLPSTARHPPAGPLLSRNYSEEKGRSKTPLELVCYHFSGQTPVEK